MQAEKAIHMRRELYIISQNTNHYSRKKWYRQIKKENLLLYVYILKLKNF